MASVLQDSNGLTAVLPQGATRGAALTGLSGAATTFSTSAVQVIMDGEFLAPVAAVAGGATPTTDAATGLALSVAPGRARGFLFCFNSAGAVRVLQSNSVAFNGVDVEGVEYPQPPTGFAPFAAVAIGVSPANGSAFNVGVSNWNTAGVTIGPIKHLAQLSLNPLKTGA